MTDQIATVGELDAQRARVAAQLAAAAARKRFVTRRKRFDAGYSDRRRKRAGRIASVVAFLLLAAAPSAAALAYFGWIAADQYVAEARFVLGPNKATAAEGPVAAILPIEIARDTQVVAAYLRSRALAEALDAEFDLRAAFGATPFDPLRPLARASPDWFAGLPRDATAEELVDYWRDMTTVRIAGSSGVVTFRLRAFSPDDALALAGRAVERAEALLGAMNRRVWTDAVGTAERLFAEAAARLSAAETALAAMREASGTIDPGVAADALVQVAARARGDLLALEQERAVRAARLSPGSSIMRALDNRIGSMRREIAAIEALIAAPRTGPGTGSLASVMERIAEHEVEREIAQRQFLAAAERLERARIVSEAQMLYLHLFVPPALAEEALYPRRGWWIAGIAGGGLLLWALAMGGFTLVRDHMA